MPSTLLPDAGVEEGELCPDLVNVALKPVNKEGLVTSEIVAGGSAKPNCSLSFFPPAMVNGSLTIKPPTEIRKKGNSLWSSSLVGFFLHSRLPFRVVPFSPTLFLMVNLCSYNIRSANERPKQAFVHDLFGF